MSEEDFEVMLRRIDHIQARNYERLPEEKKQIARAGLERHLDACTRMDVEPDRFAVREIIEDAKNGRAVWRDALHSSK